MATQRKQPNKTNNNFIDMFTILVHHEDDFIGTIAYALYRNEKVKWCNKFEQDKKRKPTLADIDSYKRTTMIRDVEYRSKATSLYNKALETHINIKKADLELQFRENNKPTLWEGIKVNLISSIIFLFVPSFCIGLLTASTQGWDKVDNPFKVQKTSFPDLLIPKDTLKTEPKPSQIAQKKKIDTNRATHIVKSNETIPQIANIYNIDYHLIFKWNAELKWKKLKRGKFTFPKLKKGQVLIIHP